MWPPVDPGSRPPRPGLLPPVRAVCPWESPPGARVCAARCTGTCYRLNVNPSLRASRSVSRRRPGGSEPRPACGHCDCQRETLSSPRRRERKAGLRPDHSQGLLIRGNPKGWRGGGFPVCSPISGAWTPPAPVLRASCLQEPSSWCLPRHPGLRGSQPFPTVPRAQHRQSTARRAVCQLNGGQSLPVERS